MSDRIILLRQYIQDDPTDPFLHYALAMEFAGQGQTESAYADLCRLAENQPDYLPTYYQCGQLAEKLNKIDDAVVWYRKGIELAKIKKDRHTEGELQTALSLICDEED